MSARSGAKTILIERYGQLGGMATLGFIHLCQIIMMEFAWISLFIQIGSKKMIGYLPPEIQSEIDDPSEVDTSFLRMINKNVAVLAAEELCIEAGRKNVMST